MELSSDDDSWATFESSVSDNSELESECSTCSSSDDEDCSYKIEKSQGRPLGDRTNKTAPVKKPPFVREKSFMLIQKTENDLEETLKWSEDDEDFFNRSSTSCSSGSEEEPESSLAEWTAADTRKTIPFTSTPVINTGNAQTTLDYFYLLFNQEFVQFLADCINTRGKEFAQKNKKVFTPTTVDEVYTLLCTHFMMGYTGCIAEDILWGHRPSLNVDFNTYMRKERYLLLFTLLTYRELDTDTREGYRSWYEVAKPIADKFNIVMKALMVPGKDLNLEKTTVLYFNEKNECVRKPERIRMHLLSDDHGIFQRVFLVDPELQEEVRGETIVKALMEDFMDSGRSLFTSNMFYPSVPIAEDFLGRNTYLTGVLKKNRPRNPAFLKFKPTSSKMPVRTFVKDLPENKKTAEDKKPKPVTIVHGYNKKGVCVCKIVRPHMKFNIISTEFNAKPTVDNKWECDMLEKFIKHTNTTKRDKNLSKCGPVLQRKNNRHVAYLLQAMFVNAYLVFKVQTGKKIKFVNFLEEILYQMLPLEANKKDKENATGQKKPRNKARRGQQQQRDDCIVN